MKPDRLASSVGFEPDLGSAKCEALVSGLRLAGVLTQTRGAGKTETASRSQLRVTTDPGLPEILNGDLPHPDSVRIRMLWRCI